MRYVHVRFKNICGVVLGEGALNYSNRAFGGEEKRASTWSSSPSPFAFSSLILSSASPHSPPSSLSPLNQQPNPSQPISTNSTHLNHLNRMTDMTRAKENAVH
jgi:hypothetical protein